MVEISRDGRRIYFTNSLYGVIDEQFYPEGIKSWMVKVNAKPDGGMEVDRDFFLEFQEVRSHQIRLDGGDSSSDSYCYPS
jgi:selenium-binding protein 1